MAQKNMFMKNGRRLKVHRTEKNLKYSGGFNFGLKYAFDENNADYVLITNNDVKADKHVISACIETALSDDKIAFVTGGVYYFDEPDVFRP
ncbi:MAG: glycosyltransferase [Comamonadaceae bacterium]|nr:glycosyltransferase [Comamonadaceae bacterium]